MKRERGLHLVPAPASPTAGGGDAPRLSEAEAREAEAHDASALAEALAHGRDPLANALRAAWVPAQLDEGDLDAILARAMGEGDAPPTRLEQASADALRDALAQGALGDEHRVLEDLRAAYRSAEIAPDRNEALIAAALARRAPVNKGAKVLPLRRLLPVTVATISGVAALAAGLALMFQVTQREAEAPSSVAASSPRPRSAVVARAALIRARSTDELFDPSEKFPVSGEESARIDRIALARASDLRQNRFAAWGVR